MWKLVNMGSQIVRKETERATLTIFPCHNTIVLKKMLGIQFLFKHFDISE